MSPYYHALSSVKKFGGRWQDYIDLHDWFDCTKQLTGDFTHRALRHSSFGVQEAIEKFGHVLCNSDGKSVPVKMLGEIHVEEDLGFVPTVQDWLKPIKNHPEQWMLKVAVKSKEIIDKQ